MGLVPFSFLGTHARKSLCHEFSVACADEDKMMRGQSLLSQKRLAAGMVELEDTSQPEGKIMRAVVGERGASNTRLTEFCGLLQGFCNVQ